MRSDKNFPCYPRPTGDSPIRWICPDCGSIHGRDLYLGQKFCDNCARKLTWTGLIKEEGDANV